MRVGGVVVDPNTQVPVVILRGIDEPRLYLPIFIGGLEATAIASVLASVKMPRPMTHDLMATLLEAVQCQVARVEVTRLEGGTFFAEITLADQHGGELVLDARPSDALALALRTQAPIAVHRAVVEEAGALAPEEAPEAGDASSPDGTDASDAPEAPAPPEEVTAQAPPPPDDAGPRSFFDKDVRLEDLTPEDFGKYKM
ncbi:MAG: bifunctional nuclease family protein [Deltaproteobacteria bacterium]|nr:bifunctional nuclease family protein [Deltaproteobacteria bacterium]